MTPISLSLTGTGRDGDWLRVSYPGMFITEVRTLAELAEYVDLRDLEEALARYVNLAPGRCRTATRPPVMRD